MAPVPGALRLGKTRGRVHAAPVGSPVGLSCRRTADYWGRVMRFVRKPFDVAELLAAVSDAARTANVAGAGPPAGSADAPESTAAR